MCKSREVITKRFERMTVQHESCSKKYTWVNFLEDNELSEIYASLDDSDRYISEGLKYRLTEKQEKNLLKEV